MSEQFNFKETIEKVLRGELNGHFITKSGYLMKSTEFKRHQERYYQFNHTIHGKYTRRLVLTYCSAGNCVEDIGTEYHFTITNFIND